MNIRLAKTQVRNSHQVGRFKGASGKVEVEFEAPLTQFEELVGYPANYEAPYGSAPTGVTEHKYDLSQPLPKTGLGFRLKALNHDQPVLKNGSPQFYNEKQTFDLGPLSPISGALKGGGIGALAGGALAAGLVGLSLLAAPIAVAGAAVVGLAGAAVGAKSASGKTRELKWVETPIVHKQPVGFKEHVSRVSRDNQRGGTERFDRHAFQPIVKETTLGTWMKPVAVIVDQR